MIDHTISMMLLPGYLIELKDTSVYTQNEPFNSFGRAYFIEQENDLIASNYDRPLNDVMIIDYTMQGRYTGKVFFFPWWDEDETYAVGDIVVHNAVDGYDPGNPIDRGPQTVTSKLFIAKSITTGDDPMTSGEWEFLSDPLTQCTAAPNKTLVTANILTSTIAGERQIVKISDYKYRINMPVGSTYHLSFFAISDLNNAIYEDDVVGPYEFDTKVLLNQDYPIDVIVVKIEEETSLAYNVVYEITGLINAVNHLIKMLYCIDNDEEDCRGITKREEEKARKDMTSIMALWFSLFFKINSSYSKAIYTSALTDHAVTLINEAKKEMKRLQHIVGSYDTGN